MCKGVFRLLGCSNKAIRLIDKLTVYEIDNRFVEAQDIKKMERGRKGLIKFPEYQNGWLCKVVRSLFRGVMGAFPLIVVLVHAISYWLVREMDWYTADDDIIVGQFNVSELKDTLEYFFKTLIILFPLFFMNRVAKFQKSRMLFQSLCGDVKAMAIYLCSLTNDEKKYIFRNENDKDSQLKNIRQDTFYYYIKLRYMLCVLPPVAKHVLRDDADLEQLDDKFRVKAIKLCSCEGTWIKYEPVLEPWGSNKDNKLEQALYKQLKEIIDETGVDLFEACMLVLLDIVHEIQTRDMGYNTSIERDFIGCWNRIYGAWGPLYTNNTSQPPTLVNVLFYITFLAYSVVVPWTDLNKDPWIGYLSTLPLVFFFSLMLWIGRVIQDPFQKGRFIFQVNPTISKDSRDTQKQVYYLLKNLARFDQSYHRGYDFKRGFNQKQLQINIFKRDGSNINDLRKPRKGRRKGTYRAGMY